MPRAKTDMEETLRLTISCNSFLTRIFRFAGACQGVKPDSHFAQLGSGHDLFCDCIVHAVNLNLKFTFLLILWVLVLLFGFVWHGFLLLIPRYHSIMVVDNHCVLVAE